MSLIRSVRSGHSQVVGKSRKKGRPASKKEWDSTISNLSVHRADPGELAWRRLTRISKHRAAAQSELREREAAASGGQRRGAQQQRPAMAELQLEQWQLRDVLARSDRALAVVRDLFGDAPRRQAGFPNVTVAPGGRQPPAAQLITHHSEQPTQLSLLSESVMDPQALNEASRCSESGTECSLQHQADGQALEPKTPETPRVRPRTSPTWTPEGASVAHASLNATAAVQRVKSRVESRAENGAELEGTFPFETMQAIRQVLHPGSRNSQRCFDMSEDNICDVPTKRMETRRTEDRSMNLEMLQEMIEKIDKELREYEHQTGCVVTNWLPEKDRGVTSFTFSLVNLISRLTYSLKECGIRQWQEKETHQQLLEKSDHQQALIDALTAEFLTVQDKIVSLQANLQQYVIKTDKELYSLKQMLHRSTEVERDIPRQNIAHEVNEIAVESESLYHCANPKKQGNALSMVVTNVEEEFLKGLYQKQPSAVQYKENQLENERRGQGLPEHSFSPAVLLSPPRQRNSQIATGSQITVNLCQESPRCSNENKESNGSSQILKNVSDVPHRENDFAKQLAVLNQMPDCQGPAQQWKISDAIREHKNLSLNSPVSDLPCMHSGAVDDTTCNLRKMENNVVAEGSQNALNNWLKHQTMLTQITELQLQNSALKAQLGQFKIGKLSSPAPQIENVTPTTSDNLEQRIADLNHQSAEARSKLLHLIEQQRQISSESVSPTISPIPPEGTATGTGSKTLEVLIPLPSCLDSSMGSSPSLASKIDRNRSIDHISTASSSLYLNKADGNRTLVTQGTKPEKLKEEGWFALSTHTMQL
ncbi:spindle and centriole-associated protein 1 [Rhinoraja longicauda]